MTDDLDLSLDVNVSGLISFEKAIEIVEKVSFGEVECHYETENGINGYSFESGTVAGRYLRALAGESDDFAQKAQQYVLEQQPDPDDRRDKPYEVYTGLPGPDSVSVGRIDLHGLGLASNRIGYTLEVDLAGDDRAEERVFFRNYFDMERTYDEVDKLAVMHSLLDDLKLSRKL